MALNVLDYIMLGILVLLIIQGFMKGFISSLAAIAALIVGIWAAIHFSNYIAALLTEHFHPSQKWLPVLAYVITFLLVVIALMLLAKLAEKLINATGLGFLNRLGGGLLGIVKGAILVSVLILLLQLIDPHGKLVAEKYRKESFLYSRMEQVVPKTMRLLKTEVKLPWVTKEKQPLAPANPPV